MEQRADEAEAPNHQPDGGEYGVGLVDARVSMPLDKCVDMCADVLREVCVRACALACVRLEERGARIKTCTWAYL